MQSGVLSATLTSAETFVSMRIYEQTRHATLGGENTLWMLLQPLVMARRAWKCLTPARKRIFQEAADTADEWFAAEQEQVGTTAVDTFRANNNQVRGLTADEFRQWVDLARRAAWDHFAKNTRHGRELLKLLNQVN